MPQIEENILTDPSDGAWIRLMALITQNSQNSQKEDDSEDGKTHTLATPSHHKASGFKDPHELSSQQLEEVTKLWTVAEERTKHVSSVAHNAMEVFIEHVVAFVEYGSEDAKYGRSSDMRAAAAEAQALRERMKMTNGEDLSDEQKALERRKDNYRLENMEHQRNAKQAEVEKVKAHLESEEEELRNVELQLEALNAKSEVSLVELEMANAALNKHTAAEITPGEERDLKNGFAETLSLIIDQTAAKGLELREETSNTGPEMVVEEEEEEEEEEKQQQIDDVTKAIAAADRERVTVVFQQTPGGYPNPASESDEAEVTFRIADNITFKFLKERTCRYYNLPDPTLYELYCPAEDAVWYELADVVTKMALLKNPYGQVVLRRRIKHKNKYVKQQITGDDGALKSVDVRTLPI